MMKTLFERLWTFDTLFGPRLVRWVYLAGLIALGLTSLYWMFSGFSTGASFTSGLGGILLGVVIFVAGGIVWRFTCEFTLVLFQIHERISRLVELAERAEPYEAELELNAERQR